MTLILSGSDGVTFPDSTEQETGYANGIGFRNRIINGDMRIDQRNAGAAVSSDNSFPVDRIKVRTNVTGATFTAQQSTTVPASFVNSVVYTTGTGATAGVSEIASFVHNIEGTNTADLGFGSANAKNIAISFWVRSSITGTFVVSIRNSAGDRNYPATYTISSADTWEYKTISVAGDTSGTWLTNTGIGIQLWFDLGSGSDFNGTANAWTSSTHINVSGSANVVGTSGATFYITGVQLEVGSVATPFERRPYGTELSLCQRYYQQIGKTNNVNYQPYAIGAVATSTIAVAVFSLPVTMRATPTFTFNSPTNTIVTPPTTAATNVTLDIASPITIMYNLTVASGLTTGNAVRHLQTDASASSLELSAEL